MSEETVNGIERWLGIASKVTAVLFIPGLFVFNLYFDQKLDERFADQNKALLNKFITHSDADHFVDKGDYSKDFNTVSQIQALHAADSGVHHSRADVVTKDLYQQNRHADRAETDRRFVEISGKIDKIDEKQDQLLELVYGMQN